MYVQSKGMGRFQRGLQGLRRGMGADSADLTKLYPMPLPGGGFAPFGPMSGQLPMPTANIVWTDCPDGSTVPADVGCPSYGQTISDYVGAHPGVVYGVVGGLFALIMFAKAGR